MTDEPDPSAEKRTRARRVKNFYQTILTDFPDEWTPLEAVVSIKCLDDRGEVCLLSQKTENLSTWEAIGMLISATDDMRAVMSGAFAANEDDE